MRWLLPLFILIPALEIGVFIWIGRIVGPWWVVVLIFLSGLLGITMAKQQGIETFYNARLTMQNGNVPTEQIFDGICILLGAILLFAPGFITDFVGLFLVIPWTRKPFRKMIIEWAKWKINQTHFVYRK